MFPSAYPSSFWDEAGQKCRHSGRLLSAECWLRAQSPPWWLGGCYWCREWGGLQGPPGARPHGELRKLSLIRATGPTRRLKPECEKNHVNFRKFPWGSEELYGLLEMPTTRKARVRGDGGWAKMPTAELAAQAWEPCGHTGPHARRAAFRPGLTFCCHCSDNTFPTRGSAFSFCTGPHKLCSWPYSAETAHLSLHRPYRGRQQRLPSPENEDTEAQRRLS